MNLKQDVINFKKYKARRQNKDHLLSWYYTAIAKNLIKPLTEKAVASAISNFKQQTSARRDMVIA